MKQALRTLGSLVLVGGILVALLVAFDHWIMPPSRPIFDHPSALDTLIDSRLVIGLIRLLALVFAVYLVASVVSHIAGRRWLVSFGGLFNADSGGKDRQDLQNQLAEADENYATLLGEYEMVVDLLKQAVEGASADGEAGGGLHDDTDSS